MSGFVPFELEEWQSNYEHEVRWNLADSGVHPVLLRELLDDQTSIDDLLALDLHYPVVGGTARLRELIAAMHPGADASHVLVTVGAAEANTITAQALVRPGDHVVVLEPGYRQLWGTVQNLGATVDAFHLREDRGWRPDLDELRSVLRPDTRLVCVANPNNPVGTIMDPVEMDAIIDACREIGAWLMVDEVYRGSERLTDDETPTVWGRYERIVTTGSLSKSYGMSGTRVGWLVAPTAELRDAAWRRHEYATIATSNVSMHLAELALAEPRRSQLIARTRGFIREGWSVLEDWLTTTEGLVHAHPPAATALAFVGYDLPIGSVEVAHHLRRNGVLVAPGTAFGVEHHLRITHGLRRDLMEDALAVIGATLSGLIPR